MFQLIERGEISHRLTMGEDWMADLMTVVEVVPLVAGAAPIVIGRGVIGAVVSVLGLLVESTGLGVLDERLGVKVGRLFAVKSGAHLNCTREPVSIHVRGKPPLHVIASPGHTSLLLHTSFSIPAVNVTPPKQLCQDSAMQRHKHNWRYINKAVMLLDPRI